MGHTVHEFSFPIPGILEQSPTVGKGVIIGREVVLIGDISIGNYSTIITNSVVNKSIPEKCLAGGMPARIIREKTTEEMKILLNYITNSRL